MIKSSLKGAALAFLLCSPSYAQPTVSSTVQSNQPRSDPIASDPLLDAMEMLVLQSADDMSEYSVIDRFCSEMDYKDGNTIDDRHIVNRELHNATNPSLVHVGELSQLLNVTQLHDDKFNPKTPEEAWGSSSVLPHDYWMRSKSSLEVSGVTRFWEAFSNDYRGKDSFRCNEMKRGPMNCFALTFWGDLDFECPIDKTEACQTPDPEKIIRYVEAHWNGYSTEKKVAMARIIHFTAQSFRAIQWNLASKHNIMGFVALEAQAQIPKLVKEFSPQKDKAQLAKCEMTKAAIKFAIDVSMELIGLTTTIVAGPGLGKLSKGSGKAFPILKEWLNKQGDETKELIAGLREKKLASHIKNAASLAKFTNAQGTTLKNIGMSASKKAKDAADKSTSTGSGDMPYLEMHLTKARGMCGNLFGVAEDNTLGTIDSVTTFIVDYLTASQDALEDLYNSLMGYQEGGIFPVMLDSLMDAEYLQIRNMALHKDTKSKIKKSFEHLLISQISAGSRCYMKCEERKDALEMCKQDSTKSTLTQMSRFCPEDNVRCQMEGWPKQEKFHKATFVHGLPKAFQAHGISPEQLLNASWHHYLVHGTKGSTTTGRIFDGGAISDSEDMLYLPVSVSKVRTIQDLDRITKFANRFPWSSGGFKSESTKDFLQSVNVHPSDEKELSRGSMPKYLKRVPEPLNQYLLLCEANMRWPRKLNKPLRSVAAENGTTPTSNSTVPTKKTKKVDGSNFLISSATESRCAQVLSEVNHFTDEVAANLHFCNMEIVVKGRNSIIADERAQIINPIVDGTKIKCRKYQKSHMVPSPEEVLRVDGFEEPALKNESDVGEGYSDRDTEGAEFAETP